MPTVTPARVDAYILVEAIAAAAERAAEGSNVEQAHHLTRYAAAVLSVDPWVARAWSAGEWAEAHSRAASDAVWAVRELGRAA